MTLSLKHFEILASIHIIVNVMLKAAKLRKVNLLRINKYKLERKNKLPRN